MIRSLYSGVSGMKANQTKMDVISNNISNVNTVGFKAGRVNFKDLFSQTIPSASESPYQKQIGLGVALAGIDTVFNDGSLQLTGRELDFALEGNGFFKLLDANGNSVYTRDGSFAFNEAGDLVNSEGLNVVKDVAGVDTPITTADINNLMDVMTLVNFENPAGLEKLGGNKYGETTKSGAPVQGLSGDPGFGTIRQGVLEMSNVDLATEFTDMIVTSRAFQANSRSITTSDEILQELLSLKR